MLLQKKDIIDTTWKQIIHIVYKIKILEIYLNPNPDTDPNSNPLTLKGEK